MLVETTLDARDLAPPEPFDIATAILRQLQPGHYLRMLHRRVPLPSIRVLPGAVISLHGERGCRRDLRGHYLLLR